MDAILGTPVLAVVPHVKVKRKDRGTTVVSLSDPEGRPPRPTVRPAPCCCTGRPSTSEDHPGDGPGPGGGQVDHGRQPRRGPRPRRLSGRHPLLRPPQARAPSFLQGARRAGDLRGAAAQGLAAQRPRQDEVPNLLVLPSGKAPSSPAELLGSNGMVAVLTSCGPMRTSCCSIARPRWWWGMRWSWPPRLTPCWWWSTAQPPTEAEVARVAAQLDQVGRDCLAASSTTWTRRPPRATAPTTAPATATGDVACRTRSARSIPAPPATMPRS